MEPSLDGDVFATQVMSPRGQAAAVGVPVPADGAGDSSFLSVFSAPPSPTRATGDAAVAEASLINGVDGGHGATDGAGADDGAQQDEEGTERLVRLLVSALKNEGTPKVSLRLAKMPTSGDHALPSVKEWTQWYDVKFRSWAGAQQTGFAEAVD
ncbi:MAG: hypothetical protein FJ284_14660, partial [Planctomycetes bacterium]|nr:hypothetical protein [Planctomycetota bacterium]